MTIIYQNRVATASLGGFLKLLTIWKGSIYKLVYKEMLIFSGLYAVISITYRLGLTETQRRMFENLVIHCSSYTSLIPISFVLGFYVSLVVARWWQQFMNVPWPDRTLFMVVTYMYGHDEKARMLRRTIARYMLLGLILICRSISMAVMKRFPTVEHIMEAGFMTKEEEEMWDNVKCKYHKFWVPILWANNILVAARREGRIETDFGLRMIIQQLADFRDKCSTCFVYDWITIPLVYTQVVTLSLYTFFAACLIARQYLDPQMSYDGFSYDLYIPVFTLLQFFFYMGWLKVAEQLINPFGEDDDDYDINWLLDRHITVAMTMVDQCYGKYPTLVRDMYWNEEVEELPYTKASLGSRRPNFLGSTFSIARPSFEEQRIVTDIPHYFSTRRGSLSSTVASSLLSLFSRRHSVTKLQQNNAQDYLGVPSREDRAMSVPNGGAYQARLPPAIVVSCSSSDRLASDAAVWSSSSDSHLNKRSDQQGVEQRKRANTDIDEREPPKKVKPQRKFSFPLTLLRRKDNSRSGEPPGGEPKPTRFVVEAVSGDTSSESGSKVRRNSQKLEKVFAGLDKPFKVVSRPTLLSAIEEQNTVTSLSQMMQQQVSLAEPEYDDEEEDGLHNSTSTLNEIWDDTFIDAPKSDQDE